MKVLLLGATGGTGREIVREAGRAGPLGRRTGAIEDDGDRSFRR
jgi:uncharacterized protein YbjT (DUF2867 family)